ncbi:MAG: methyltransferase domain-containing protein [Burkholderiaceae bacterium]
MKFIQRAAWILFLGLSLGTPALAQAPKFGDEIYQPIRGQMGRDVMWLPTAQEHAINLLKAAKVSANDLVYDLGAGDGIITIIAATEFGAKAVGIEYNPKLADLARRNAQRVGVADKVNIITGDIFVEKFSAASVVTLYLLPELNLELRPLLLKMKAGTRVVSNEFDMEEWQPDQTITTQRAKGFLWIVPADVAGIWSLQGLSGLGSVSLHLSQRFQKIGGQIFLGQQSYSLLGAQLMGDSLGFQFVDDKQRLYTVKASVQGGVMVGEAVVAGETLALQASRR